jgi:hypothetical protein
MRAFLGLPDPDGRKKGHVRFAANAAEQTLLRWRLNIEPATVEQGVARNHAARRLNRLDRWVISVERALCLINALGRR